ncbi:MAG: YetF domain-containing protein, partial [Nonlabens sp.]
SPSLFVGALLIGLLYLLNYLVTLLTYKSKIAEKLMDNSPILLMENGKVLYNNLKKTKVTENELRGKLREANVIRLTEVKAVILESTGDVSVMHTSKNEELEDYIMKDVKRD